MDDLESSEQERNAAKWDTTSLGCFYILIASGVSGTSNSIAQDLVLSAIDWLCLTVLSSSFSSRWHDFYQLPAFQLQIGNPALSQGQFNCRESCCFFSSW